MLDLVHVRERGHLPVLVSSGAVACGRAPLGLLGRPLTLAQQQATSAVGQGALFDRYREAFARHGVVAAQVLLSSADVERRVSYLNVRNALRALLDVGAIPIVNENDATATEALSFGDNDVLAAQLAILLEASGSSCSRIGKACTSTAPLGRGSSTRSAATSAWRSSRSRNCPVEDLVAVASGARRLVRPWQPPAGWRR